jgi:hypothetical protein
LDTFEYHNDGGDFESELVSLVENSHKLCRLICRSNISCTNVIHFAELRGAKWKAFRFSRKKIYKKTADAVPECDSDKVIAKNSDGEYVILNSWKFHEQFISWDRKEEQNLIEVVSQKLGQRWVPSVWE